MKVLLLDNFDSFTFNLLHYLEQLGVEVDVKRNNTISVEEVDKYSHIVISPGPGLPEDAGICMEMINKYHRIKSILGVCLGAQALAVFYGGAIYNQKEVAHGIKRGVNISLSNSRLLKGLPEKFQVGLYHSWAINLQEANELQACAFSEKGILMAFEHPELPLAGVQFHPESIMSDYGLELLKNWLEM